MLAGFLGLSLLSMVFGWFGLRIQSESRQNMEMLLVTTTPSVRELGQVQALTYRYLEACFSILMLQAAIDEARVPVVQAEMREMRATQARLKAAVRSYIETTARNPDQYPLVEEIERLTSEILREASLSDYSQSMKIELLIEKKEVLERLEEQLTQVISLAMDIEDSGLDIQRQNVGRAEERAQRLYSLALLLLVVISVGAAFIFAFVISNPLMQLTRAVRGIGSGKMKMTENTSGVHEIVELREAFQEMLSKLEETMVSKEYVEAVMGSMADGLLLLDENRRVTGNNSSLALLSGYAGAELVKKNLGDLFPHSRNELLYRKLEGSLQDDTTGGIDCIMLNKAGEHIACSVTIAQMVNEGTERYVLGVRDMRDKYRMQSELNSFRDRLVLSQQAALLGNTGAVLAHRLSQPLSSIRLFLQQSARELRGQMSDSVRDNLSESLREIERASEVVQQVLVSTRSDSAVRRELIHLERIAVRTRTFLTPLLDQSGLSVIITPMDALPQVWAVESDVEEIFYVLIQNAIQAVDSSRDCILTIAGRVNGSSVELDFTDTCGGICPQHLASLFDPFFTTKKVGEGTGLGLAILKQMVERYGGSITVRSTLSEGSVFTVRLPLAQESQHVES